MRRSGDAPYEVAPDFAAVSLPGQDEPGQREVLEGMPRVESLERDIQVVEERDDEGERDGGCHEEEARPARFSPPDLACRAEDIEEKERREAGGEGLRDPRGREEQREEEKAVPHR